MTIDLEKRRAELLGMRARHLGTATHLHDDTLGSEEINAAASDQHPADHASTLVDKEIAETLLESVEHVVQEIDDALARIDDGVYGICVACGKPIPEERLDAVPYATLCLDDKKAQEQR